MHVTLYAAKRAAVTLLAGHQLKAGFTYGPSVAAGGERAGNCVQSQVRQAYINAVGFAAEFDFNDSGLFGTIRVAVISARQGVAHNGIIVGTPALAGVGVGFDSTDDIFARR